MLISLFYSIYLYQQLHFICIIFLKFFPQTKPKFILRLLRTKYNHEHVLDVSYFSKFAVNYTSPAHNKIFKDPTIVKKNGIRGV